MTKEDEEVRGAGHRPLEQPALAEDLQHLVLPGDGGALEDALDAVRGGLTVGDQLVQEAGAAARDRQRHEVQHDAGDQDPGQEALPRTWGWLRRTASLLLGMLARTGM